METFKEIDIKYYDNSGNVQVRCTVPVTQDALVHYELMQSHYCKLSFKLSKPIYFLLGDFIDTPYGRFELIDLTKVKDNDTIGYSYELQFDAYYRKLKNKILKYRPNTGSQEATFSLTSKISTHVEVIMKNLSYYAELDKSYLYDPKFEGEGTDYTYVIDASVDASASKLITYSNASILDAIANIAQTFNCEWWFEGNILHFGTCENTNAIVDFKLDGNIVSMSSSQNQSTYANRVYAFGAARNLPSGYKNDADADITKDGVVEKRLMLPTSSECSDKNKQLLTENGFELKNGYIQVGGLREDQYVEGVTTNDDIYPKNLIKTSKVTSYEKDVEDESTPEEGDYIKRTFYRVNSLAIVNENGDKTGDMAFRKSYILSGKTLHIVFQSGSLNGMDFECEFNPDGVSEIIKGDDGNPILKDGKEQINPNSQVFEIVANEDYGRFLPDTTLHPKDGDTFVLYNWDSSKLGDTLVSSASNELLADAIKNLKKSIIDPTTYTCSADVDYSYNQGKGNLHGVGDRVNLYNKGYGESYRSSRIIGYELNLDIPYDGVKYYVGEKPSYSRLNAMESKIEELVYNGQSYLNNGGGSGGSSIYIIKSYDKTSPTEYNVYSARAVNKSYLSKLTDDEAQGLITFAKGLVAKALADLAMGATFGNNAKITELGEAVFDAIKSIDYDNAAEQGFSVEKEKNGKYHAFFTNLTIWGKAIFHELEIRKLSYSGGNIYLSGAGSKLIKVVPVKQSVSNGVTTWVKTTENDAERVGWKCYLLADNGTTATMNDWQEGDQARCQTMGEIVSGGTYQNASNKSYWRTIPDGGVSTQNEKIYGTKTETYLDEDGNEKTREVQVELYDGQAFAWIVIGKHCGDIDGYDDEFSVGYNGSNPAPLETRDIPAEGDTIVLDGNRHRDENTGKYDKTDRQNVIILETTGEYAPRIACYANITEYKHTINKIVNGEKKEVSLSVFETSPKGGTKINSSRFEWISDDGSTINIINYRGDWVSTNTYHKNDQVNHNNAVWVCVANSGVSVKEEPSDGSSYWKKVLSGGKGEKGDKGDDGLSGNGVVPVYVRSKDNPTLPTSTDKNNLDNGWSLAIPSVADVKNVSYSDSSWTDYNDGSYTWKKSPTTANNSTSWCLVTFTTTQANQAVKFVIKSFSEPRYDYIFLSEIDASVVPPKPDYKGASRAVSGNGVELSITDVVATAGTHTVYICYGKDASGDYNGDYGLFRIESMAGIPLWQSNGKEVFTREDGGTTKSKIESWSEPFRVTGENGTDGKDAYRVVVSPSTLIFDTDDNGRVTSFSGKTATIRVYQGDKDVSKQFSKYDRLPSNYYNCNGSLKDLNTSPLEIQVTEIETQVVTDTAGNKSTISKTNGFLEFILTNDSATVTAHVDVQVNVAKFTGQMVNTNKRFSNTLREVGNSVNDKMDKFDLTEFKSEITQTAREISLSVSEKSVGRRNLLVGSAFLREDNHVEITDGVRIEMNSGYQGTNCIHSIDETDGTPHYRGAFWDGSQGGKSIKITKGKKYVLSCYYKTNDTNGRIFLEALYTDEQTNAKRTGNGPTYLTQSNFVATKLNKWELFTTVIDTTNAGEKDNYLAFNFFEYSNDNVGRIDAYICRPMVEEGDTYGGWTLSQSDYDIIGANLIDNSRTLDVGGNVLEVNGQKALVGDAYELTYIGSDDYNTFYRIKGSTFQLGVDYTISFEVRGDAEYMGVYAYYPITNTKFTFYAEPQNGAMTEVTDGGKVDNYVALIQVKELSKQQRVWAHFRFKDRLPEELYFQFPKNAEQTGVTSWNVTITRPKIEAGAVVTEYTERKSDLVDKASLKAAGIVVDSESVTLYGNQVHIKKNKTDANDTVLIDNETGQVSAGLINADKVVADGIKTQDLEARNLNVTGNSRLGIFRIKTSGADERDQYTIAGDMITYSGDYKFPDGTTTITSDDGLAYLMYKPLFIRQGAPDAGKYMRLGNCYTEWDDSGFGFDHSYLFNGASARYVCGGVESECKKYVLPTDLTYNTHYFPVSYIYSIKSSPNDPAFAINVQKAKNTTGERTAIQTNGAIRGVLAPNSMSISWNNETIPNGIGVVICTNGSEITLTLPTNPLEGQTLIIIQGSDKRVYIVPYGDEVIYCGGQTRDRNNKFFSGMIGQFNIFVFIRGNWQLQWMNYRL